MAQPNVVREPSMDEILASIRRIIESNEPVTQSSIATAMAEPEGFVGFAANDDSDEEVPLTVDDAWRNFAEQPLAPRQEPKAPIASVQAQELPETRVEVPAEAPKALSLADVAARVRAAAERNPGLRDLPQRVAPVAVEPPAAPVVEQHAIQPALAEPQATYSEEPVWASQHEFSATEQDVSVEAEAFEIDDDEIPSAPLISADAGQQVARSFQDLALAVDQAERRSFDEIATDLLRPMLQEWLDDNLPTLVERLVREEIERVARGARR